MMKFTGLKKFEQGFYPCFNHFLGHLVPNRERKYIRLRKQLFSTHQFHKLIKVKYDKR